MMNRKGLKSVFITLRIWLMNYLSALLWIMTLLSDVLITCLMWISETPFRKSYLSMQVQRNFTSLLYSSVPSLHLTLPTPSPRSTPSSQWTVTLCYLLLPLPLAHGWLKERRWSLQGQMAPWGHLQAPAGLASCSLEHAWVRVFFSSSFGKQPKWHWKDVLPFR